MIAVDTNVVLRLLVGDDPRQAAAARAVFASHQVVVQETVLLEVEWVLRQGYRISRSDIVDALRRLVGLEGLVIPSKDAVVRAIDAFAGGCDFADALHVLAARGVDEFVTFDRDLARRAKAVGLPPVRLLEAA